MCGKETSLTVENMLVTSESTCITTLRQEEIYQCLFWNPVGWIPGCPKQKVRRNARRVEETGPASEAVTMEGLYQTTLGPSPWSHKGRTQAENLHASCRCTREAGCPNPLGTLQPGWSGVMRAEPLPNKAAESQACSQAPVCSGRG